MPEFPTGPASDYLTSLTAGGLNEWSGKGAVFFSGRVALADSRTASRLGAHDQRRGVPRKVAPLGERIYPARLPRAVGCVRRLCESLLA
eukprot:382469-Prorocentrum_minimum.AAC.1